MSFEHISTPVSAILANIAAKIDENKAKANTAANKIGTAEHHKTLGAEHEHHAETAQILERQRAAWEALKEQGFVS